MIPTKPKKSSNYHIFKIRYYADGINVRKREFNGDIKQGYERGKEYFELFWSMVAKITGHPFEYWNDEYFFYAKECAIEELCEKHDIYIPVSGEYYYWYVPKTFTDMPAWMELNCKLPFKKLIRAHMVLDYEPTTSQREEARKKTKILNEKYFNHEKTI